MGKTYLGFKAKSLTKKGIQRKDAEALRGVFLFASLRLCVEILSYTYFGILTKMSKCNFGIPLITLSRPYK
jgi:hypothetical protein